VASLAALRHDATIIENLEDLASMKSFVAQSLWPEPASAGAVELLA
jgi:hypothetical protein